MDAINKQTLNIVRPALPAMEDFADDFAAALQSGQVTNNGSWVQEFELRLTGYLGVPTIVFNSGQAALMAMLRTLDLTYHEVICPSFTFVGTPNAVRWNAGWPIFADIEADTLCIDPVSVREKMKPTVKAILGVDPYGICCDYTRLVEIGREYGIPVLIDSAPAFGSYINGQVTGGFADAQIFSFHATKPFSTMEGGAMCSHNEELIARAKRIRNFGQHEDGDCVIPGFNGKMMEVCAMVGMKALEDWPRTMLRRKIVGSVFRKKLAGIDGLTVVESPSWQKPIWTYQPVLIDRDKFGMTRDELMVSLKEHGIVTRRYYTACHRMTAYRDGIHDNDLPVTEVVANQVLALPLYPDMEDEEMDRIVAAILTIKGH